MRPWQKNLVDMKLDSDDVKRRLKDSCFGTDFNISIFLSHFKYTKIQHRKNFVKFEFLKVCCRKPKTRKKWYNTHKVLQDYLSQVHEKWAEWWYFYYFTTRLDDIKSKLLLCNECASYFSQNYYHKDVDTEFINLFEESGGAMIKPLSYYMHRQGELETFFDFINHFICHF